MDVLDTVVIGAGQAGLSASYHLVRRRISHVVLDANSSAGGAWQHRWDALTMRDVHGIAELPDSPVPSQSDDQRANSYVPAYFADYESTYDLPVLRPVHLSSVRDINGLLVTTADDGRTWTSRTIVSATGTWSRPFIPRYRGQADFAGTQFHTVSYPGPEYFRGLKVVVVGGGTSAVQFIGAIGPIADRVVWTTRREPEWITEDFTPEYGRKVVAKVEERVRQGLPPRSVSSVTGLGLREQEREAERLGIYADRRPMFDHLERDGVRWSDGSFEPADSILWATGFRYAIEHLAPLNLRSPRGGIQLDGTTAVADPRIQLVGYGPSASTIGANRAGRQAAIRVVQELSAQRQAGDPATRAASPTVA